METPVCLVAAVAALALNSVSAAQLRGVQLPMRNTTEADFVTLEEWGVTLVRYQMTRAFLQHGLAVHAGGGRHPDAALGVGRTGEELGHVL